MPVPYLGGALKGWATSSNIKVISQTVVDFETAESGDDIKARINFQPMPASKVNRKPEEQRTWKWWSLFIYDRKILLATDDIIQDSSGIKYRVDSAGDWRSAGFTSYEAIEDYL